ncbi:MAG: peroxiredoxin [Acidobacteriota bacterium]|nr:peroxiredoxin [Acidobacteriota bacterium]
MSQKTGNQIGETAPDFELKNAAGKAWRLFEQRGKTVVLLFYPADNTPVCTSQLCSVRDHWSDYQATGAEVVGISTDSSQSHENFAAKHRLPLRLLSDEKGEVVDLYAVKSWIPNRSARAVFVIDKQGIIRYRKVQTLNILRPKDDDILAAIKESES